MDREHDQDVVVPDRDEDPMVNEEQPSETPAAGVRKPPLLEVTTPSGRVWYLVNLN
jgi:hypothetical protein